MNKPAFLSSALFFVFFFSLFTTAEAQSAEDILENMIEAQGGRAALENIKDTTLIGTTEMKGMDLGGSFITYQKEPDMLRTDSKVRTSQITQACDGEKAWMTNPFTGEAEEMPEPMAKDFIRSSLGNAALLDPGKFGILYTLEGKRAVGEHEYYVLQKKFPDGFQTFLYVDPENFFLHKTVNRAFDRAGNESLVETVFSDYKKVDALTLAHSIVTYHDGREFMIMQITEVKFNTGLDDVFFKMKMEISPF